MHPDPALLGAAVRLALSAVALFAVIQFIVEPTLNEGTRQRLFALRRDLFLYMAAGGIAPSAAAYTELRTTINGALRFSERLTIPRAIYLTLFFRKHLSEYRPRTEAALALLEPEQRQAMTTFRERFGVILGLHMLIGSVVGWIIGIPFVICTIIVFAVRALIGGSREVVAGARNAMRHVPTEALQADAESLGEDHLPLAA